MAVAITIGGVAKSVKRGSLKISATANGRATAGFTIESTDGTYRPAQDAEVIITDNGTRIFAGLVERPRERGIAGGKGIPAIATTVSAVDFHAYAERRFVNEILAAGTLKSMLQTLIANYLTGYSITLDGSQVDGPSLPALDYKYRRLDEVLNQLATLTADSGEPFVWRIDHFKVLSMFQPSTEAAPFDLTGDPIAEVIGDIEVATTREHYANRIIVKVPSKMELEHEDTFTGDGMTDAFTSEWSILKTYGYVTYAGNYETLGPAGDPDGPTWEYDLTTNTITRIDGAPANGEAVIFKFDGEYSGEGIAEDAAEIAAHGIWERVVQVESVPDDTTVQALADGYLAKSLYPTHTLTYRTRESGVAPGQSQTVTVPRRNLSGTAVITDVVTKDVGKTLLEHQVTAVIDDAQTNLGRGWRDVYTLWRGDLTGGAVTVPVATTASSGTGSGGPGGPDKSVQYNDAGVFGGDGDYTYDKASNSIVCGGGGSSITAALVESCQVFGYDNHIADA